MSKKRRSSSVVPSSDPVVTVMVEPVTDPVAVMPEFAPGVPVEPTTADTIRAYHASAGFPLPDGWIPSPSHVGLIDAIRIVVPSIVRTPDAPVDYDGIVRAFADAFDACGLPPYDPATPNTTRVGGLGITDAQNVVYHAVAVSGVFVPDDIVACIWTAITSRVNPDGAIVRGARCRYTDIGIAKRYATSTLSAYMRGDHGGNPMVPDAVNVIRPWYVAGGVSHAPKPTA